VDGGSTIWVPNVPIALPDIPQSARAKAQSASEWCSWVAACARPGAGCFILKGTLVHGARVGTGKALGALPWIKGTTLIGRARESDGGKRQPPSLGIDSSRRNGTRVRLSTALGRDAVLTSNEEVLKLASDRSTPSIGGGWARERGGVAVGGHGGCLCWGMKVLARSLCWCEVNCWSREMLTSDCS
jgi:hypothetical protein